MPEELERLKRKERRRVYGTLEAHGILGENLQASAENGRAVCDPELAQ